MTSTTSTPDSTAPHAGQEAEAAFRQAVRAFCLHELPQGLKDKVHGNLFLNKQDNLDFLHALHRKGWVAGHWPRQYGGCDWTPLERFMFEEESTLHGAPWLIPFGVNYVGPVIYTFGTQAQKDRFLPPILDSSEWWAQGYSEPGAGSDLASIKTSAVRSGKVYRVTGQKIWTSYAQWADWMFCLVRTNDEGRPQQGISFLLIDMRSPGITIRPIRTMDGCHHVNEVFLDDVEVPAENLVGEEGKGWHYAKFLLGNERVLAAETGRSMRNLQHLKRLVRERQGGEGVNLQEFERRLHQLDLQLHVLRAFCLESARHLTAQASVGVEASIMKIRGSELQQAISEATMDWLGASATVYDPALVHGQQPVSLLGPAETSGAVREYLHGRASTIYGGSNEIQRNIISKAELGL